MAAGIVTRFTFVRLVLSSALLLMCLSAAEEVAPPSWSHDSLRNDEAVMRAMYRSLNGSTAWPEQWRTHWESTPMEAATALSACDVGRGWPGATCQHALKRIVHVVHRSGHALGQLPDTLSTLTATIMIDFSENRISGPVPPFGAENQMLESLALAGNAFSGPIPDTIGAAPTLRFLSLSRNKLNGPIPDSLGRLSRLEALLLDGNPELSGDVPWPALLKLAELRHLRLDGCPKLRGTVRASEIMNAFPKLLALELAGSTGIHFEWDDDRISSLHLLTLPGDSYGGDGRRHRGVSHVWRASSSGPARHVPRGDYDAPVRFMAMGDFGTGGQMMAASRELASDYHFVRAAEWVNSSFAVTVGDNLYVSPHIPQEVFFHESFELPFSTHELDRPWYAALGNHDSRTETGYAVRNNKWKMNTTEYHHVDPIGAGVSLELFVHDTLTKYSNFRGPLWNALKDAINASTARYKVTTGHYPPLSSGCHKTHRAARDWNGLVNHFNVTALFAGHDHHSEALFDPKDGAFHFLVGGFARGPCVINRHRASLWADRTVGGFAYVTVSATLLNVTFVSELGHFQFKQSVPFDWASRRMGRIPNAAEILEYAAAAPQSAEHHLGEPSRVETSAAPAPGTKAPAATAQPPRSSPPEATVQLDGVQQPSSASTAGALQGDVSTSRPPTTRPAKGIRTSGDHGLLVRRTDPLTRSGGSFWWFTAVACALVPVVVLYSAFVDNASG